MSIASRVKPGPIDAVKEMPDGRYFSVEWETGNISSSHRALNKMAVGLLDGMLVGGILILPSRDMYQYLTDRIGNYAEIEPYFPFGRICRSRKVCWRLLKLNTMPCQTMSHPFEKERTEGRFGNTDLYFIREKTMNSNKTPISKKTPIDVLSEGMFRRLFPEHLALSPQLNEVYELALAYYENGILSEDELVNNGAYFIRVRDRVTRTI